MQEFNTHNLSSTVNDCDDCPRIYIEESKRVVSRENSKVSVTYKYFLNATFVLYICTFACSYT